MRKDLFTLLLVCLLPCLSTWAQPADYTWTTPSQNSSESMPCGGGDIGLNVWVENGEVLFYIGRSGAFDEYSTLLKLGRVRLKLGDAGGTDFHQTLRLNDGYVEILLQGNTVRVWADVHSPVIHVETESARAVDLDLAYESWRYQDRAIRNGEGRQNSLKWAPYKGLYTTRDSIRTEGGAVTFVHRNPAETMFDRTVAFEGMDAVKDRMWNPLAHLTTGGRLWGDNLTYRGTAEGTYHTTDYRAWQFASKKAAKKHHVLIALHTEQTPDLAQWQAGLDATIAGIRTAQDRKASRSWWNAFWQRSFIEATGAAEEMTRNYTLFRYMLGCNAYGTEPTKFNGGLFTFDSGLAVKEQDYTPDYRNWGGGTMTAQNQRLVYWPMLKSGDYDMMPSEFNAYLRMLGNAELRSQFYWGHDGGCFTEQIELYGLPNMAEYGLKRPESFDKGVEYNAWLEYTWDTVLEFCQMILQTHDYDGQDIGPYIPLIESALTFFDEHYQYLAAQRGIKKLDGQGKLILFPGSGCETYKMANNATSTVAALQTVLKTYIAYLKGMDRGQWTVDNVSDSEETQAARDSIIGHWEGMLQRVPDIALRTIDGHTTIAPAKTWERVNNVESPQLYPVFPWRIYGAASDDKEGLQMAIDTYRLDPDALEFRSTTGWKQDNIWAACLGLTDEAARLNSEKLANGPHRFPAFWGPGFDWTPDHNHGGSGMIGLQEMLLQADGDRILLFPAWPKDWDVHFRLHAPGQTTVEAELKDGQVVQLKVLPESRQADVVIQGQ